MKMNIEPLEGIWITFLRFGFRFYPFRGSLQVAILKKKAFHDLIAGFPNLRLVLGVKLRPELIQIPPSKSYHLSEQRNALS